MKVNDLGFHIVEINDPRDDIWKVANHNTETISEWVRRIMNRLNQIENEIRKLENEVQQW